MHKFIIKVVVIISLIISIARGSAYCEEAKGDVKTMSGYVLKVDWVGSLISVRGDHDMTFVMLPDTKITRGVNSIGLFEIRQGDYVVIKYYDNEMGDYQAIWISLQKQYPPF